MNDQDPQWVRTPKGIPPHIKYAHGNGRGMLTFEQILELVKAINSAYVANKQGKMTYLAQHQARAEMNRIFGYGNWDLIEGEPTLLYEETVEKNGTKYVACYRASVTVHIRDLWGMPVCTVTGTHAEANANLPDRSEAHAMAITSVLSYAFRRAMINLGDRFGLGLYNGGSLMPHGQYTIQLEPGQLFDWQTVEVAGAPAAVTAAPVAMPTHETIKAEPVISDDGTIPQQQQQQQQGDSTGGWPAQGAGLGQATQQTGGMQEFHQAQQVLQQQREQARAAAQPAIDPSMQARLQAGFKTDGGQG